MKRTELKRNSGLKRSGLKRGGRLRRGQRKATDRERAHAFWLAARAQGLCAVTHTAGPWDAHHVVERQRLKQLGWDEWDPRNALRVLTPVHVRHTAAVKRIPMHCLKDENLRFAFELMGAGAHVYLHRMYNGTDPRLDRLLDGCRPENVTILPQNWVSNDAA